MVIAVAGIADIIHEARSAGASFEVLGPDIIVTGAAAIPPEVRGALKLRRDELLKYLAAADIAPSSSDLLKRAGVDVAYIEDDGAAAMVLAEILADAGEGPVGLDVETTARPGFHIHHQIKLTKRGARVTGPKKKNDKIGLDPRRAEVRLIQVYGGGDQCVVFDMRKVSWATLAPLWQHRLVIHNVQFELGFLLTCGLRPEHFECTMQAAGLMLGVHRRGLAAAAQEYLGWEIPKDLQKSDWGSTELSEDQITYAALDAVAALHLWFKLEPDLRERGRWNAYVLQRDAIPAAVEMERVGIGVDLRALDVKIKQWGYALAAARKNWEKETDIFPPATPNETRGWLASNLDPDVLAAWPRTDKTDQLSTSASNLERAAHLPAIQPLLEIKRLEKLLSSFGPSLRNAVHPVTGRIHANYLVAGTKSGRWSCKSPNLQQIPGERLAPGFRSIFRAPPGRVLIGADYSQMELRAAAEISGDEALRQIYADGRDLHRITAAATAGVRLEEITKEQRNRAKPVNFGSIYGMGAPGLAASAWNNYRVEMSLVKAEQALAAFFRKFSRLRMWMRNNADACQRRHRIEIGIGRVVEDAWEPEGIRYTQCCNLPVQGACADAMMRAVAGIHRRIHAEQVDAALVAQVHDEIIIESSVPDAERVRVIMKDEMITAFVATFPGAQTTALVEVKTGKSWAELK